MSCYLKQVKFKLPYYVTVVQQMYVPYCNSRQHKTNIANAT